MQAGDAEARGAQVNEPFPLHRCVCRGLVHGATLCFVLDSNGECSSLSSFCATSPCEVALVSGAETPQPCCPVKRLAG